MYAGLKLEILELIFYKRIIIIIIILIIIKC